MVIVAWLGVGRNYVALSRILTFVDVSLPGTEAPAAGPEREWTPSLSASESPNHAGFDNFAREKSAYGSGEKGESYCVRNESGSKQQGAGASQHHPLHNFLCRQLSRLQALIGPQQRRQPLPLENLYADHGGGDYQTHGE